MGGRRAIDRVFVEGIHKWEELKEWDYSGETRDRKVISLSLCCHGSETWPAWWDQILMFWKQTFVFLSFWCFYLLYNILIHFACILLTCTLFCSIGKTHSNLSLRLLKICVASLLMRNQTQPSVFNCDEIQKLLKNTDSAFQIFDSAVKHYEQNTVTTFCITWQTSWLPERWQKRSDAEVKVAESQAADKHFALMVNY